MLTQWTGAVVVASLLVFGANANGQDAVEPGPGKAKGYLDETQLPDSVAILPPPPASGSAAMAVDEFMSEASLKLQKTSRFDLARRDADISFPAATGPFACAFGITISKRSTPRLYTLLRRSLTDAALLTHAAKKHYKRARPFMSNQAPICSPDYEARLRRDGSYPSGHTAIGWAWALILSEIAPEKSNAILKRGWTYGESRIVCNVHWQSDVASGRIIGSAVTALLHANDQFQADLQEAKKEYRAVLSDDLKPQPDCRAEKSALSHTLSISE